MPLYDRADLHRRLKRALRRPENDAAYGPEDYDAALSDAQQHWFERIAVHEPRHLGVRATLETDDGGRSFSLPEDRVGTFRIFRDELYADPMRPGMSHDSGADYFVDGDRIRFHRDRPVPFPQGGPVIFYVPSPPAITEGTEPRLNPPAWRQLLVWHAAADLLRDGGMVDPAYAENKESVLWAGNPQQPGDIGILGILKKMYEGDPADLGLWWRSPDLSNFGR